MTTAFDPAACEEQFVAFFRAVHDNPPFPWQRRLAVRVCDPGLDADKIWPKTIALPTAAGKTSCIDIAVFALAYRENAGHPRTAPRRIFFVVDRRIVVDQAYEHARKKLAVALDGNDASDCREVADRLREIARPGWLGLSSADRDRILLKRRQIRDEKDRRRRQKRYDSLDELEQAWIDLRPLDVYALRGGMYREDTWVRSPLQPTVVTSTVDQVGSRLLFRGYGVTDGMKPVHAGLVGNDALILLDEAHCSRPFAETAAAVAKYRGWHDALAPFAFVQMTATLSREILAAEGRRKQVAPQTPSLVFELDYDHAGQDLKDERLRKRVEATKPARLVVAEKARGKKARAELVQAAAAEARGLRDRGFAAVGVIVNRVATAQELRDELSSDGSHVIPLTGRMRTIDRDVILKRLEPLFSGGSGEVPPTYVVATQCLEVGADLDFHALVTECASLDALRQRFGRLNRIAARDKAEAVIVIRGDQTEDTEDDTVYGPSLANTWKWLKENATDGTFDFGVAAVRRLTVGVDLQPLNAPAPHAPVLLPAHLDCWVQTAPIPTPDPDPALYLHGPQSGPPDVQVVFRADLGDDPEKWAEVVALCPPSSSEALPVRLADFRRWLAAKDELPEDLADIEGTGSDADEEAPVPVRSALRWEGPEKSKLVNGTDDDPKGVRPNATYVLSVTAERLDLLGDFPPEGRTEDRPTDYGDAAFQRSRDRAILRLTPTVVAGWPDRFRTPAVVELAAWPTGLDGDDAFDDALDNALRDLAALSTEPNDPWQWLPAAAAALLPAADDPRRPLRKRRETVRDVEAHPAGGVVVTGAVRLRQFDPTFADDESSESPVRRQVTLEQHTRDVIHFAERFATGCGLAGFRDQITRAARWHDLGKADPRFQAMLRSGSPRSAAGRELLAKSGAAPSPREREEARAIHLYPKGGRHELLSVAFAADRTTDPLTLHLIATHHGDGRPFAAPYWDDTAAVATALRDEPPRLFGEKFEWPIVAGDPVTANAAGPDRFWQVVRQHGWWGAAYLEAVFRLADHAASRAEQEEGWAPGPAPAPPSTAPRAAPRRPLYELPMSGLVGSNPLAFLAALGVLRCLTEFARRSDRPDWLDGDVKLAWGRAGAPFAAVLHLPGSPSQDEVAEYLAGRLDPGLSDHPAALAVALAEGKDPAAGGRYAELCRDLTRERLGEANWVAAHYSELVPSQRSQLQIVRRDYLPKNFRNIMKQTTSSHLLRSLFARWDYADGLEKQSLHWEPSEDRRHAYQWHEPSIDPVKDEKGGMLGANRLALEAWPLFLSVPYRKVGEWKLRTRGFQGDGVRNTFWTWPVWGCPVGLDGITSLLSLPELQELTPKSDELRAHRVFAAFRSQRILVGKTPNLTPAATT